MHTAKNYTIYHILQGNVIVIRDPADLPVLQEKVELA